MTEAFKTRNYVGLGRSIFFFTEGSGRENFVRIYGARQVE
jgi:hypothetical protein